MLKLDILKQKINLLKLNELELFKSERNIIFVDKDSYIGELKPKSTLILSPSFYWIKREKLPIKYAFEAKKLLPSLFDGILPEQEYTYISFKESDNNYIVIAYSDKDIVRDLQKLSIKEQHIKEIYFAQSEFQELNRPIRISQNSTLVCEEKIVCKIPSSFVDEYEEIDDYLRDFKISKNRISVNIFSHALVDVKMLKRATIAVALFILSFGVSYYLDMKTFEELEKKRGEIASFYSLPATKIQLNSLKSSLERDSKAEISQREVVAYILNSPLIKGSEHFKEFSSSKNSISFSILLSEPKRAEALKEYLQQKIKIDSIRVTDSIMRVEAKS